MSLPLKLHYVHLNPVRAGLVSIDQLEAYRWSSYWYLINKRARPSFLDCSGALEVAGGLIDTPKGRRQYLDYLKWLSSDDEQIDMRTPDAVSRYVCEFRQNKGDKTKTFRELTTKVMT